MLSLNKILLMAALLVSQISFAECDIISADASDTNAQILTSKGYTVVPASPDFIASAKAANSVKGVMALQPEGQYGILYVYGNSTGSYGLLELILRKNNEFIIKATSEGMLGSAALYEGLPNCSSL